jgi:hypothetical protein
MHWKRLHSMLRKNTFLLHFDERAAMHFHLTRNEHLEILASIIKYIHLHSIPRGNQQSVSVCI